MKSRLTSWFGLEGSLGPVPYLLSGLLAFAAKYSIDRWAAGLLTHRPWQPWEYLNPLGTTASLLALGQDDRRFLLVMSAIALPFIALGISLTLKRLRSLSAPSALVLLFFIPFVNLLFFLVLSIVPAVRRPAPVPPPRPAERAAAFDFGLALAISIPVCLATVWIAVKLSNYGFGLFFAVPFCLGLMSSLTYAWQRPRRFGECAGVALAACGLVAVGLLAFAFEGAVCLIMAAPIAAGLALLGAAVGYQVQEQRHYRRAQFGLLILLALYPPAVIGPARLARPPAPEFSVRTAVDVDAPPQIVWRHVVAFTPISEPRDWLFRSGIAYPMRAEIRGHGPGAVRYCIFSTGPFVEPVTIWDEPRLLEFAVTHNPAPMREWSPYRDLHPPHLDGFLVSHKGHFRLTPLPNGRTRLEGVTWYEHNLWPASYWQLWSDYIIHRIHLRVLNHVRREAERDLATYARGNSDTSSNSARP